MVNTERGRHFINFFLWFGIILMIVLISLSFVQINKLHNANKWILHSHEVIEETDKVLTNINYAESKMRAYFISGKEEQIRNLDSILIALKEHAVNLSNLTRDNVVQQMHVNNLITKIDWRINDIHQKIKLFQKEGLKKLLTLPPTATLISEQIRQTVSQIITYESYLLNHRNNIVETKYILINRLIFICGLFSLIFLFVALILLNHQIKYRTTVEKKLKQSEDELFKLAYYDSLTGLANRTMVHNNISEVINSIQGTDAFFALLFIDLDNFKNINDSLGHEVGDKLLKAYSTRLKEILGENNIIARLGGDEFIVILDKIKNQDDVSAIANEILYSVAMPFIIKSHKIFVTSSIGISLYPINGNNSHELLKNADIAMYKAKELGKNNVQFCAPALTLQAQESALIEYELHRALANKEFYLVYQPIISLKDHHIESVEVLIRWQRKNNGVVYPGNFIKLAENNGLIMPLGDWILKQACIESKNWISPKTNKPIKIAVNVSTRQFILSDFSQSVTNILQETQFDPGQLELEITESALFENSYSNLATLHKLKELGIKISIDDFGTGYSSLSYLCSFAIDKLKIDRSFIKEVNPENYTSRIIKSIINMAHDLNIIVLAEGVETNEQLEFLKSHQCDEAQGYYYSHPLTAEEFTSFLAHHDTIKF